MYSKVLSYLSCRKAESEVTIALRGTELLVGDMRFSATAVAITASFMQQDTTRFIAVLTAQ